MIPVRNPMPRDRLSDEIAYLLHELHLRPTRAEILKAHTAAIWQEISFQSYQILCLREGRYGGHHNEAERIAEIEEDIRVLRGILPEAPPEGTDAPAAIRTS